jgi:hypothetical protein
VIWTPFFILPSEGLPWEQTRREKSYESLYIYGRNYIRKIEKQEDIFLI